MIRNYSFPSCLFFLSSSHMSARTKREIQTPLPTDIGRGTKILCARERDREKREKERASNGASVGAFGRASSAEYGFVVVLCSSPLSRPFGLGLSHRRRRCWTTPRRVALDAIFVAASLIQGVSCRWIPRRGTYTFADATRCRGLEKYG